MRIGHGYDAHRLAEGRALVLCGVNVPYHKGLLGHSDADAASHAVIDALLGAAALGDIGQMFPDGDPATEGVCSLRLLEAAAGRVRASGYEIGNVDITIIAQAPKLAGHIAQMRQAVAAALGAGVSRVSVKATTEEHMGFTGGGEGIAAHAVCLLLPRHCERSETIRYDDTHGQDRIAAPLRPSQ